MLDCVIVGAGLAGLAASRELVRRGKSVLILEARDRIGGRVESLKVAGQLIETGGQWVSPGHEVMHELISEAGLALVEPAAGDLAVLTQGRVVRSASMPATASLTPFEIADLGQGVLRFRRLASRVTSDEDWRQANASWLAQPISHWAGANLRLPAAQKHFTAMITAGGRESPDSVSLADALAASAQGIDLESFFTATGGLKQQRVAGGMHRVVAHLSTPVRNRIRLNCTVTEITQNRGGVVITLADGAQVRAAQVLLTLPPWLVSEIGFTPGLPRWRAEVTERTSPGGIVKAFVIYDNPWWQADGFSGQSSADSGAVRVTFDCSDDGPGVIMGFFEEDEARYLAGKSAGQREEAFISSLEVIFGPKARLPHRYVERDWAAAEFSKGSHGAHFAPGIWTAAGQQLSESVGRVYFAGSEYAARFNGYLEGALRSGRETARKIALASR